MAHGTRLLFLVGRHCCRGLAWRPRSVPLELADSARGVEDEGELPGGPVIQARTEQGVMGGGAPDTEAHRKDAGRGCGLHRARTESTGPGTARGQDESPPARIPPARRRCGLQTHQRRFNGAEMIFESDPFETPWRSSLTLSQETSSLLRFRTPSLGRLQGRSREDRPGPPRGCSRAWRGKEEAIQDALGELIELSGPQNLASTTGHAEPSGLLSRSERS